MSTLATSNPDQLPLPSPSLSPSSSLFSLPDEIVLEILARVPKRYYPILSCVSKKIQILVRSPEIHKTRSLLGKDSLYICFFNKTKDTHKWFTLRRIGKYPTENLFFSVNPFPARTTTYSSIIAVGQEIFFCRFTPYSSNFTIYDSRSGKYSQGPSIKGLEYRSVGLVGDKAYVIGVNRENEIQAAFLDLKTQTWKTAPAPEEKKHRRWMFRPSYVLDKKICVIGLHYITCYDTRDGSCESLVRDFSTLGMCVMENVLYVNYSRSGLMWYDSKLRVLRIVNGLDHFDKNRSVGLAEYYGKLAYMWLQWDGNETNEVWCRMIALDKSEVGIHGTAEPSQRLGIAPRGYEFDKCLSLLG